MASCSSANSTTQGSSRSGAAWPLATPRAHGGRKQWFAVAQIADSVPIADGQIAVAGPRRTAASGAAFRAYLLWLT
jgi:hypothetical protein